MEEFCGTGMTGIAAAAMPLIYQAKQPIHQNLPPVRERYNDILRSAQNPLAHKEQSQAARAGMARYDRAHVADNRIAVWKPLFYHFFKKGRIC